PAALDSGRSVPVREVVPLTSLEDLRFGGWDVFPEDAYDAARDAGVLEPGHLEAVRDELSAIRPMKAACQSQYVRRLELRHVKRASDRAELAEQLREDIRDTLAAQECDRAVGLWCGSTEVHVAAGAAHQSVEAFRQGLARNDPGITNSHSTRGRIWRRAFRLRTARRTWRWIFRLPSSSPKPAESRWAARI